MKILYFISLIVAILFFNACAPQKIAYSPEEIDTFAIPPSAENNLFSPPPKGYARLIMYRDDSTIYLNDIDIVYENYNGVDYEYNLRALCRLKNDSSCIVNIRAGYPILLSNYIVGTIASQGTIFTPKNQHIYCLTIKSYTSFVLKNKETCLKEYKKVYKPSHREYQEKWFNRLVKKGYKSAYKE